MHVQSAGCLKAIYGKPRLPQGLRLHDAYANARSITKRPRQTPRIVHVGEIDCKYLKTLDGSQRQCVCSNVVCQHFQLPEVVASFAQES